MRRGVGADFVRKLITQFLALRVIIIISLESELRAIPSADNISMPRALTEAGRYVFCRLWPDLGWHA
jgi:hypothetical protein